jgi:GNAT superfamily N-acetyltransferase
LLLARAEPKQIRNFAANCNGRPIGETTLFIGAGVAGIYDVTVQEEFRRRGVGTALLVAALDRARELGVSIAILGATWAGQRMYVRVGFRKICRLSFWKYGKAKR